MSKMLVVAFDDETKAYEGAKALRELHNEGSVSVYGAAIVARDMDGKVSVKDEADEGPIGTAVGMMTGALIGVLGGPAGVAIGAAAGTMLGATADLVNVGVGFDFVDDVGQRLEPGMVAVVAEIEENWTTPLDSRMEDLGGTVFRRYRADVEDDQIDRDIAAMKAEYDDLKAEIKATHEANKDKLHAKMDKASGKLRAAGERAEKKLESMKKESDAKIKAVEAQIAKANAETKEKLQNRVAELKSDYAARSAKLKQAGQLAKEALV